MIEKGTSRYILSYTETPYSRPRQDVPEGYPPINDDSMQMIAVHRMEQAERGVDDIGQD
jgi:hypothetical protein